MYVYLKKGWENGRYSCQITRNQKSLQKLTKCVHRWGISCISFSLWNYIFYIKSNIYDISRLSEYPHKWELTFSKRYQDCRLLICDCVVWQTGTKCLRGTFAYHIKDKGNRLPQNISTCPLHYATAAPPKVFNFNTLTQPTIEFTFSIPCVMCSYVIINYYFHTERQIFYTSKSMKNIFKLIEKSKLK